MPFQNDVVFQTLIVVASSLVAKSVFNHPTCRTISFYWVIVLCMHVLGTSAQLPE